MMATTWGADDLQVIQRVPGTEIFPQALGPWLCPLTFMSTERAGEALQIVWFLVCEEFRAPGSRKVVGSQLDM